MRLLFWSLLCLGLVSSGELVTAARVTRSLAFKKGSSFFYRVNYKITILPNTPIFAQAAGFKMAFELPTGSVRVGRSIVDVHEAAELVYESHGFDGKSCLLKNVCEAMEYASQRDGVIAKILKILMGSYANNDDVSKDLLYCDVHVTNCPLQLIGIDSFISE
ncbi:uncharacterized protein LOC128886175 [Hylaeus anthracinus]|uniref:uncharacterized protein LOC128886175 n=1 Tax=Hylaeus anthracinus TaxID=313031 RepID=UPI0023B9BFCE|nr:uncharacterized protein LOC128886175 [Hylaeus anthracinus]